MPDNRFALFSKPFDISRDQFIIFRMGSQREACLFTSSRARISWALFALVRPLNSASRPSGASWRKVYKLPLPHATMALSLQEIRRRPPEKQKSTQLPFFAEIHAVVKNFRIVLRWNGNRVLKKVVHPPAAAASSLPGMSPAPHGPDHGNEHGVNAAGKHVPAIRIYRFQAFRRQPGSVTIAILPLLIPTSAFFRKPPSMKTNPFITASSNFIVSLPLSFITNFPFTPVILNEAGSQY